MSVLFCRRALLDANSGHRRGVVGSACSVELVLATAKKAVVDAVLANFDAAVCATRHLGVVKTQVAGKIFVVIAAYAA